MRIAVAGASGAVGRHVVDVAHEHSHEIVALTRSAGFDLTRTDPASAAALATALAGVDAVIDVTSTATQSSRASRAFFGTVTENLVAAERAAGVGHHVVLSIVGSDRAPHGYYAGKALQERMVGRGDVPWTIQRATQFHEFAAQMLDRFAVGPIGLVPTMRSQPVSAREVAEALVGRAEGSPLGLATDLAGPDVLRMRDMVRDYAAAVGRRVLLVEIPLPGGFGRAMRDGTVLASPDAEHGRQTFGDWLAAVHPPVSS